MIPNLNGACYAVRSMVHISDINTVKSIYFAYFYSITKHGIIFWSNFFNRGKIFTLQKKLVKRMAGAQPSASRRRLLKTHVEILLVPCQCILSLMNFNINNQELFQTNSYIHNTNARKKYHLHRPNARLNFFQTTTFYAGIKIFNSLPTSVTTLKNDKAQFKTT